MVLVVLTCVHTGEMHSCSGALLAKVAVSTITATSWIGPEPETQTLRAAAAVLRCS
jgi:hypothetical protein